MSAPASNGRFSYYGPLLALPGVYGLLAFVFLAARGPYWFYYNLDPDYFYLLNSVTLAEASAPDCVVHPGTPVQTIGALALRLAHLCIGHGSLRDDVFARPEFYLGVLHSSLLLVTFVLLVWAGAIVRRATASLIPALLLQAAPLFSFTLLEAAGAFKPEPLLTGLSVLFGAMILAELRQGQSTPDQRSELTRARALGAVAGLALATKLTFLPFAALPWFCLRTWKHRAWFSAFLSGGFLVGVLPALKHWKWIYNNLVQIVTHKGAYGAGESGVMDWSALPQQAFDLLKAEPHFAALLALSVFAALIGEFKPAAETQARRALRLLGWLTLFELAHVVLTAKHPMVRYLLPSYALLGCNLVLLYIGLGGLSKAGTNHAWPKALLALVGLGALVCVVNWNADRGKLQAETRAKLEFYQSFETDAANGTLIYGHVASAPPNALYCANALYSRHRFTEQLAKKYPDVLFFDVHAHVFVRQDKPLTTLEFLDVLRAKPYKMIGNTEWVNAALGKDCELKLLRQQGEEGLFEILAR